MLPILVSIGGNAIAALLMLAVRRDGRRAA